jgi:hypothetical protein
MKAISLFSHHFRALSGDGVVTRVALNAPKTHFAGHAPITAS